MITDTDLSTLKKSLRSQALVSRRAAHWAQADRAPEQVCGHFLAAKLAPPIIAGYWPIGDELDVRPLLAALSQRGLITALPVVVAPHHPLEFRVWAPGQMVEAGPHATRHPSAEAAAVDPDCLLIPLLAFDDQGHRLGYGGGYYDRTLQALRMRRPTLAIGVAYAAQRLAVVPSDDNDQILDYILTEQGLAPRHPG